MNVEFLLIKQRYRKIFLFDYTGLEKKEKNNGKVYKPSPYYFGNGDYIMSLDIMKKEKVFHSE